MSENLLFQMRILCLRLIYRFKHISLGNVKCFSCGRKIFGTWDELWPACDYWDAGGFCIKDGTMDKCWGEGEPLCKKCARHQPIYLLDACMEFWEPEELDDYEQVMDEYPHATKVSE